MHVRPGHLVIGPLLVGSALTVSLATASSSAADGPLLYATMTGPAEEPVAGDPDGLGWAHVRVHHSRGQVQVCVALKVQAIAPASAAHIHKAPPGAAGPAVITLTPPTDGSSRGCHTADEALLRDIHDNPGDYYVNVHNADYPAGAIRGQLHR